MSYTGLGQCNSLAPAQSAVIASQDEICSELANLHPNSKALSAGRDKDPDGELGSGVVSPMLPKVLKL